MLAQPASLAGPQLSVLFGKFLFGFAIYYGIQRFFKDLEDKLTEDTRLRIAVWLLDLKVEMLIEPWPRTFAKIFDQVFGSRHLSWLCFRRSCIASLIAMLACVLYLGVLVLSGWESAKASMGNRGGQATTEGVVILIILMFVGLVIPFFFANIIPDYFSLLETRFILHRMQLTKSLSLQVVLLAIDFFLTAGFAWIAQLIGLFFVSRVPAAILYAMVYISKKTVQTLEAALLVFFGSLLVILLSFALKSFLWFYPAFLTSIWTWLYVVSGFLVRTARKLDCLLTLSNRFMDLEHRPLQCVGIVAAALCTLLFWAVSFIVL